MPLERVRLSCDRISVTQTLLIFIHDIFLLKGLVCCRCITCHKVGKSLSISPLVGKIYNTAIRSQTMKIRSATQIDLQDIAAIHIESWKDSYSDVLPAEFLAEKINRELERYWNEVEIQSDDIILVAEKESLVGFVAVWCRPIPFIDNLHVIPSQRSQKVGSALMKAVAKELINKGHKTAYLWVFESNERAIRFYGRLGGIQKEQSMKNIFGYDVLSRKIEWYDVSKICEN